MDSKSLLSNRVCAVTGGSGYIGAQVVLGLLRAGATVIALGRRRLSDGDGVIRVDWGLENPEDALFSQAFPQPEVLIHSAHDWRDLDVEDGVNVRGSRALFDWAMKVGVKRIVFISSVSARSNSLNKYGQIKWKIEQECSRVNGVSIRVGLVFGGVESGQWGLLSRLANFTPILPMVDSKKPVQPIFLKDLAAGILAISKAEKLSQSSYVLASPEPIQFEEFLRLVALYGSGRRLRIFPLSGSALLKVIDFSRQSLGVNLAVYERVLGLISLKFVESTADVKHFNLRLSSIPEALKSGRRYRKRIFFEAWVLLRGVSGEAPSFGMIRQYVYAVKRWYSANPIDLPYILYCFPSRFRYFEPLSLSVESKRINSELLRRVNVASAIVESSYQAVNIFPYRARSRLSIVVTIVWVVVKEIFRLCLSPLCLMSSKKDER